MYRPIFKWKDKRNANEIINFEDFHNCDASVDLNIFHISCTRNLREYKDGTYQYMIYLSVPGADSKEIITLTKVRGKLIDAIKRAETILLKGTFSSGLYEKDITPYDIERYRLSQLPDSMIKSIFLEGNCDVCPIQQICINSELFCSELLNKYFGEERDIEKNNS